MAKPKAGSKFNNNQKPKGAASNGPSLDTLAPPADGLPSIPTPIDNPAPSIPASSSEPQTPLIDTSATPTATTTKPLPFKEPIDVPLPPSAVMGPTHNLPNVAGSASPSRTATPATAAYETPGIHTPMGSRTPSPRSFRSSTPASARRTLNIDWPFDLVVTSKNELMPFERTFETPSLAPEVNGAASRITCNTEYVEDGSSGIRIALELGYWATIDLKIFNQFDSTKPIYSRFRDTADRPEFHISWKTLRLVTGPNPQPSIMLSLTVSTAPAPPRATSFDYTPPTVFETTSPAAIEALAHFLDQPGGHDVVFCFPDHKHLYADRYVLQRASRYFRSLFEVRNRESGLVPMGMGGRSAVADDDSDAEKDHLGQRGRSGSRSSSRSRRTIHGDGTQGPSTIPLPADARQFTFQRTGSPLMDDNVFVMNINETSFNTFRAFLYYLYTGFISFSPLTSSFQFPDEPPYTPNSGMESTLEQRRLDARNALVGDYMRKYPNRPVPVSPKSIYAVARKYEVPALEAQALSRISTAIFHPLVATTELFSAFTRVHDSIKQAQLRIVIDNWDVVVKSEDWAVAKDKGKAAPDPYFAGVLCEILEALPPRS